MSKNQIEYVELCKTIRQKIRENTRAKNMELINKTIEQNQSLKMLKKQTSIGTIDITSLNDKHGNKITNQGSLFERIKEFYQDLYSSSVPLSIIDATDEKLPEIVTSEVMLAIKEIKKGKSLGPDELDIDTIKEAGKPLAKELTKLFNCC